MSTTAQPPYKAYNAAAQTASKTRQLVMLYDGAISFLQQAADAMVAGDVERRYTRLTKASEIVMALQSSLDFGIGGSAPHVLNNFYSAIIVQIMGLHRSSDRVLCTRIIAELKEMRDTWDQIDRGIDVSQARLAPVPIADPTGMSA